jgi:protein TonB
MALALALSLHTVLLFGVPMERWTFRFPTPQRFEVVLLPPESAPVVIPSSMAPKPEPVPKTQPEAKPKPVPKPKPEPKPVPKPKPKPVSSPQAKTTTPAAKTEPSPATPLPQAGERSTRLPPKPTDSFKRPKTASPSPGRLNSTALLSQVAQLETEHQRQQSAGVRTKRVTLTDTRSVAGFYAADWARKVTRVGEMNFPDVARRLRLSAGPLLEVVIRADGHLQEVRIRRSSGNAELDRAAQSIVKLAAPYPPFPADLRQQADLLRIESPWRFDPGGRVRAR